METHAAQIVFIFGHCFSLNALRCISVIMLLNVQEAVDRLLNTTDGQPIALHGIVLTSFDQIRNHTIQERFSQF